MVDRQAVVWTRIAGPPVRMGSLYATDREARFQYAPEYVDSGLPGASLVYPPAVYRERPVVYRERPVVYRRSGQLHPCFQALLPPAGAQNFQRKLLLGILRERGEWPAPGLGEDWALLMLAGHGGIGHVDLFADDDAAREWYADSSPSPLMPVGNSLGKSLRELMAWLDADTSKLLQTLGPTPTVGGALPKILLSIAADGWNGEIATPRKREDATRTDIVLKFEPTHAYPGLVELESLAYQLHERAGFEVPRHWSCKVGGMPALAVERFDREASGRPLPLESWFSILAAGARDIDTHTDGSYDRIARAIDTPSLVLAADGSP